VWAPATARRAKLLGYFGGRKIMLQLISIIVLGISVYNWYWTNAPLAIFLSGAASASCICIYAFGLYNDWLLKEVKELKEVVDKL
jgi:hypothetical protein